MFPGSNARSLLRSISAATIGFLVAAAAATAQQTYSVLKTFQSQGDHPWAGVIQASDGFYYGTTLSGGPAGQGTVYRVAADGAFSTLHVFTGADGGHPRARLLQGSDGRLYGTTWGGGSGGGGTIFHISPDGTGFAVVHAFAPILGEGSAPYAEVFEASDGDLYGTTNQGGANGVGTIFRLDLESGELTTLHSFDTEDGGFYPDAGVIQASDGNLYGATTNGGDHMKGTLFRIETDGDLFTTVHHFDIADGYGVGASLLQGSDGALYGNAEGGGAGDHGAVFRFDPSSLVLSTVHDFGFGEGELPRGNLCQGVDGSLYGTTFLGPPTYSGSVFRVDTNGANFETLKALTGASGAKPYGGVIQGADGALYGTTEDTGNLPSQNGTVFRVATDGSTFDTVHSFRPFVEGESPQAEVILASDGALYGTTSEGGLHGFGTIFRMTPQGADFTVLHDFTFADGARPFARLIEGPGAMLYATTQTGGDDGSGRGTVFKFDPVTAELTELHAFHDDDGRSPTGGVVLGGDGFLYGATESGGANQNFGTVFRIATDGTAFETLHDFAGPDGQSPRGGVLLAADGRLYGMTAFDGGGGRGTLFGLDDDGGNFGVLHDFDASDGGQARSRLTQGAGTLLYGTTWVGGTNDAGTVFRFDTSGPTLTTLHSFQIAEGAGPSAALLVGADGRLYGTTDIGGAANGGTLFRIDVDGSDFETVHPFTDATGAGPHGSVFQGANGTLYGTTAFGGPDGGGVVFRLAFCALAPPAVTPSGPTELCQGDSVTLSAPPGFANYLWSPRGETTASILVEQSGSYAVAVADADGCGAVSAPTVVTVSPYPSPEIETSLCVPPDTRRADRRGGGAGNGLHLDDRRRGDRLGPGYERDPVHVRTCREPR